MISTPDLQPVAGAAPDTPVHLYGRELTMSIKRLLKTHFPTVSFSVRGVRGTGTGWFHIAWMDGPSERRVAALTYRYLSSTFNGMTDGYDQTDNPSWEEDGRWVRGTARGINMDRTVTEALARAVAAELAERYGAPMPEGEFKRGDWRTSSPFANWHGEPGGAWDEQVRRALEEQD